MITTTGHSHNNEKCLICEYNLEIKLRDRNNSEMGDNAANLQTTFRFKRQQTFVQLYRKGVRMTRKVSWLAFAVLVAIASSAVTVLQGYNANACV